MKWWRSDLNDVGEGKGNPEKSEAAVGSRREFAIWPVVLFMVLILVSPFALVWIGSSSIYEAEAEALEEKKSARVSISIPEASFRSAANPGSSSATVLVDSVISEDFWAREEIATGRFLRDFDRNLERLEGIDTRRWRVLRRAGSWLEVEAPWEPEVEEESDPKTARLRFVKSERMWRVENLRILKEPFRDR